jgi:hypothetical protein
MVVYLGLEITAHVHFVSNPWFAITSPALHKNQARQICNYIRNYLQLHLIISCFSSFARNQEQKLYEATVKISDSIRSDFHVLEDVWDIKSTPYQ